MILVDFNQIAYACILEHLASTKQAHASIDIVRYMILNTLRSNVKKFKQEYGEVVIAYDSDTYWRRDFFPHYKANRKKSRDKSPFDWKSIFSSLDILRKELEEHLMYKILGVDGAEADDIIGYLSLLHGPNMKIMIISGDKDFPQLQIHKNVHQYSPLMKKNIVEEFPMARLKQHIIRGDSDDGIPNILSPDDVFVSGGRQKPIMEKKLIDWLNMTPETFCTTGDMLKNYKRNEKLIDLREIPIDIRSKIGLAYESTVHPNRQEFLNYLISTGNRQLVECVGDF